MLERLPFAVLAGLVGAGVGWASAMLTDWLQTGEAAVAEDKAPTVPRWPWRLLPDPIVQGASALVWAALFVAQQGEWLRTAESGLLAVPLIQVAVTDFRTRYVYTVVALVGLALGLAFGWQVHGGAWWTSLAGAAGGFALLGFFYLLGKLYVRVRHLGNLEALATGDITIAAMVGAVSATSAPSALFAGMLIGGVLAIGVWIARRSAHSFMPYGPGLCLGGLATLFWG